MKVNQLINNDPILCDLATNNKVFFKEQKLDVKRAKIECTVEELLDMEISKDLQRVLQANRVRKYLTEMGYDTHLVKDIVVSARPDGTRKILDGQHQTVMAIICYGLKESDRKFSVTQFEYPASATLDQIREFEAVYYQGSNQNISKLNHPEILKAGLIYGNPESVYCYNLLEKMNLRVGDFGPVDGKPVKTSPMLWKAFGWRDGMSSEQMREREDQVMEAFDKYSEVWSGEKTLYAGVLCTLMQWQVVCEKYLTATKGRTVWQEFTALDKPMSLGMATTPQMVHQFCGSGLDCSKRGVAHLISLYKKFGARNNVSPTLGIGSLDIENLTEAGLVFPELIEGNS